MSTGGASSPPGPGSFPGSVEVDKNGVVVSPVPANPKQRVCFFYIVLTFTYIRVSSTANNITTITVASNHDDRGDNQTTAKVPASRQQHYDHTVPYDEGHQKKGQEMSTTTSLGPLVSFIFYFCR
jgi:hypothetical protein